MPAPEFERISADLRVSNEDQDWGIVNADADRLGEFARYALDGGRSFSVAEQFALVELVIASANDALVRDSEADIDGLTRVLDSFPDAAEINIRYWRSLDPAHRPIAGVL